jgi:hypothetical protein
MHRVLLLLGVLVAWLALAPATSACAPYTFEDEDGFGFETGIAWAFRARVIDQPRYPDGPMPYESILAIDDTIAGEPGPTRFTIAADSGCDYWWFEAGDEIIGAITNWNPHHGDHPVHRMPPYAGITHYSVAAWVIRDGQVVGGRPYLGVPVKGLGTIPRSEPALVAMLIRAPDTATVPADRTPWAAAPMLLAGLVGLLIARFRRQSRARTTSRSDGATASGR